MFPDGIAIIDSKKNLKKQPLIAVVLLSILSIITSDLGIHHFTILGFPKIFECLCHAMNGDKKLKKRPRFYNLGRPVIRFTLALSNLPG
jgi:hypothetical protein